MNPDKAIELWDSSKELMFAENGAFFPDRDSIYNYLKELTTTSMNVEWKNRTVLPLSQNSASMSGNFKAHAVFKSGEVFDIDSKFTGVFVRKNGNWVLIHGHESFK
jgi:Calcium/calmodulin dependent protein kinase II Association.